MGEKWEGRRRKNNRGWREGDREGKTTYTGNDPIQEDYKMYTLGGSHMQSGNSLKLYNVFYPVTLKTPEGPWGFTNPLGWLCLCCGEYHVKISKAISLVRQKAFIVLLFCDIKLKMPLLFQAVNRTNSHKVYLRRLERFVAAVVVLFHGGFLGNLRS